MALSAGSYRGRVGEKLYVDAVTGYATRDAAFEHLCGRLGAHRGSVYLGRPQPTLERTQVKRGDRRGR